LVKATELLKLFKASGKRAHLIGNTSHGVIVGLDLEGRLFAVYNNQVINRVNYEAVTGQSVLDAYLNPGGDGLWPAPEGTCLGYSYSTQHWRVPAAIRYARFQLTRQSSDNTQAHIQCEADLINGQGVGLPLLLERDIEIVAKKQELEVIVTESIQYLGARSLERNNALIAPWSLCQFDSGPGCEVVFPAEENDVWDLYDLSSREMQTWNNGLCHTRTDGNIRYQIGIGSSVPWIEYRNPSQNFRVIRRSAELGEGLSYIDIRDASPDSKPDRRGVRYSVYSDPNGFMEIEAVGGCPEIINPQMKISQRISTRYLYS